MSQTQKMKGVWEAVWDHKPNSKVQTILSDSFLEGSVENSVDTSEDGDALSSLFKKGGELLCSRWQHMEVYYSLAGGLSSKNL